MWVGFGFEVQKCRSLTQICRPPPICRRLPPWGPLRPHRPRPRRAAPGAGRRLWPRPDPTAPRGFQQSFCTKNWFCECFGPFGWWFMSWDACGDSCTPLMINDDACTIQLPWNPTMYHYHNRPKQHPQKRYIKKYPTTIKICGKNQQNLFFF